MPDSLVTPSQMRPTHFTHSSTTVMEAANVDHSISGEGRPLPSQSKSELANFISGSVLPGTIRKYSTHWDKWKAFLQSEVGSEDPYLKSRGEEDKASLVCLFLMRRYQEGLRGKAATSVTAGIRINFAQELQSTTFLDHAAVAAARSSCKLNPVELRAKRDLGAPDTVKLPVHEDLLTNMRTQLWDDRAWNGTDLEKRMAYIAATYAYDMSARVSEYTAAEKGKVDHCVRVNDLTFEIETPSGTVNVLGGELAKHGFVGLEENSSLLTRIIQCQVLTASSKGKASSKPKVIARRSIEESRFLDDFTVFGTHSGACGTDRVFCIRDALGALTVLRGKTIRVEIKSACVRIGLPPRYFSAHSLRKGAITHMRASGATEEDRRDRGNYAPGSLVMNLTYDYATGLGPLASNSIPGGRKPTIEDVRRLIPAERSHDNSV